MRLAAARVMVRPGLGDLSPGAGVDSFGYTINFQNPNLDPTRATTLDAAAEWYFADDALLFSRPSACTTCTVTRYAAGGHWP